MATFFGNLFGGGGGSGIGPDSLDAVKGYLAKQKVNPKFLSQLLQGEQTDSSTPAPVPADASGDTPNSPRLPFLPATQAATDEVQAGSEGQKSPVPAFLQGQSTQSTASSPQQATPQQPKVTKGMRLLEILRGAAIGGLAGAGSYTVGEGAQRAQAALQSAQSAQDARQMHALERQKTQAEIANLPWLRSKQQAELDETKARTTWYKNRSNRADFIPTRRGTLAIGPDGTPLGIVKGTEIEEKPGLEETFDGRDNLVNLYNQQNPDNPLSPEEAKQYRFTGKFGSDKSGSISPFQAWVQADPTTPEGQAMIKKVKDFQGMSHPNFTLTNQNARQSENDAFAGAVGSLTEKIYGKHSSNGSPDYDAMLSEAHGLKTNNPNQERVRQGAIDRLGKLKRGEIRPKMKLEDATAQQVLDSLEGQDGQ